MKFALIFVLALAAAAGGFFLQQQSSKNETAPQTPPAHSASSAISVVGKLRPEFVLPDLEDQPRNISEWDGKIRLINFWATWCPPCVREMPMFVDMQEQYEEKDFVIIGVAVDNKDAATDFSDSIAVNYPIVYGEGEALELTRLYGNRLGVLPYSVFVGKDNKIISTHNGEITAETIKNVLLSQNVK